MTHGTVDWRDLREFKAVDLTQSFILSWELDHESLVIDIDLYLQPEHAFYEEPRPAERACFRPALLEFPCCSRATNSPDDSGNFLKDAVVELGPGRVTGLKLVDDGCYVIKGAFGCVEIDAERPILRLKSQTN